MIKRNLAVLLVAGLVLGGGALALAQGQPDRPTVEPGSQGTPDRQARRQAARECLQRAGQDEEARRKCREEHGRMRGGALLKNAVHGELIVRGDDGRFENVVFDRGTVNGASDASKVVIDRPDGKQVTIQLTAQTRYRGVADAGQLRKGEPAMVVSRDAKALMVAQRDPSRDPSRAGPKGGNNQAPPVVPND